MKKKPTNTSNGFDEWGGYMEAKKRKLEEQFESEANAVSTGGGIFQGVAIFVNGYTNPSAEELKALMLLHGGIYHHYESSRTTHIIASNLPHTKIKKLKPGEKIIKPEWIVDSISSGKLLDHKKYLLMSDKTSGKTFSNLFQKNSFENTESSTCSKSVIENSKSVDISATKTNTIEDKLELDSSSLVEHTLETVNIRATNAKLDTSSSTMVEQTEPVNTSAMNPQSTNIIEPKLDTINISAPRPEATSTKNASNEDFLGEFYNKSRLHHLSTMGAMFKQYVNQLREKHDGVFQGIKKLQYWKSSTLQNTEEEDLDETFSDNPKPSHPDPVIMHIDMDCFFVSVGVRNNPELRDQPVAVAHGKGNQAKERDGVNRQAEFDIYRQRTMNRMGLNSENHTRFNKVNAIGEFDSMSEIASCNYKAREYGLKNGMFVGQALKQCPQLKIVPYDFEGYKEVSYCLYNLVAGLTLNIEAVSCDEMYVDCSQLLQDVHLTPLQFATFLRETIVKETGCTCSTGFGSNKLQARLATKKAKPNGVFHLTSELLSGFMFNIPLSDLPGVGHSLLFKLNSLGAQTCGDLQNISLKNLQDEVGNKNGITLYNHCRGQDDKKLTFEHQRKSVSAEVNYGIRFQNNQEMETFMKQLSKEVEKRLDEVKMKGKCITVKLMIRSAEAPREASKFLGHGVCDYINKSVSLSIHISQASEIFKQVISIVDKMKLDPKELRGIGIQMSKLELQSKLHTTIDSFFTNKVKLADPAPRPSYIDSKPSTSYADSKPSTSYADSKPSTSYADSNLKPFYSDTNSNSGPSFADLKPSSSNDTNMSSPKKLIFVPDSDLTKSPKRKTVNSPRKKSPKKVEKIGDMKMYLMKAQKEVSPQVPEDFDKSVFEALPDDIKREVLRNREEQLSLLKTRAPSPQPPARAVNIVPDNLDESFLNALPEDLRQELIDDFSKQQTVPLHTDDSSSRENNKQLEDRSVENRAPSPFNTTLDTSSSQLLSSSLSLQEMRTMLREWLCESEPEPSDVEMFSDYLNQLVRDGNLSQIVILMRFLQRHVSKKENIVWGEAYREMLGCLQSTMSIKYGHELKL